MKNFSINQRRFFLTLASVALFYVATHFLPLSKLTLLLLTDLAWTFASGFVAWKCWQRSNREKGLSRRTWRLFAYAHLSWFIGMLIWDYSELIAHIVTPFPAFSDFFYILFSFFFIAALITIQTHKKGFSFSFLQFIKLSILTCSIIIIHLLVFSALIAQSTESTTYISVSLLYSVSNFTAFLYSSFFLLRPAPTKPQFNLALIVSSLFLHAFATIVYAYSLLGKNYAAGNYIDVIWLLAFALMYLATTQQDQSTKTKQIVISGNKNILRLIDASVTPFSILMLLLISYLYSNSLTKENLNIIIGFSLLLLLLFTVKEFLSEKLQQKLQADIATSQKRFKIISNTVPGIVYQFKMNNKGKRTFPYVSPRITEILGLDKKAVMKDAAIWLNQIHRDDYSDFESSVMSSFANLTPWQWQGRIYHTNGHAGWFRGESIPTKQKDGVLWTGIFIDISKQKKSEDALLAAHDHLEHRVKERTAELETAMQQIAITSNAKSEFLSHMSHEIRTPLNAISGFSQVLLLDNLNAQQKDSVHEILRASDYLLHLVDDILNLNNIELGHIELQNKPVELYQLVKEAISLVTNQARKNNINIKNELDTEIKTFLFLDGLRLKEVIINLLSNAIKYNKENGNVIIKEENLDNTHIKISVIDTGKGINDKHQSQIFTPFDRLGMEGGTIEGTGIGLTLSKKVTEAMGGTIGFTSKEGEGSEFWVIFPVYKNTKNQE